MIAVKYHRIRDSVDAGLLNIVHCPSSDMLADQLTKPVPGPALNQFVTVFLLDRSVDTED